MGTTTFVWDPVFDCVTHELDENNDVKAVYNNEPQQYGGVISQRRGTTSHYHHHDALGSTRFLTDSSGNVTDTYLHDAWGNEVASTGTTVNPFKWVGKYGYYTDDSTGQVYVRARMYQPRVARWGSMDPVKFTDGLNQFLYTGSNPARFIDPSGNKCEILFGPTVTGPTFIAINPSPATGDHRVGFKWEFSVSVGFGAPCDCCRFQQYIGCMTKAFYTMPNGKKDYIDVKDLDPHHSDRELEEDCRIVKGIRGCYGDRQTYIVGDGDDTVVNEWQDCSFRMRDSPAITIDFAPPNGIPKKYKGGTLTICRSCKVNQVISAFDPATKTSLVIWNQVHELNECRVIRIN